MAWIASTTVRSRGTALLRSTTAFARPILWNSRFVGFWMIPFMFFIPRVMMSWSWVFITGALILTSAS